MNTRALPKLSEEPALAMRAEQRPRLTEQTVVPLPVRKRVMLIASGGGHWIEMSRLAEAFAEYLHERFNDGCTSAAALYEELRALGYRGSYSSVRDYLRPFRRIGTAPPSTPKVPKVRRITSWMLRASRQPYRRRADLAHAGSRQLPTSRSNCRACHIVRGDAHRTPWRTIELVDVSRRSR